MAAQRAQPWQWLRFREIRWSKSIASPPSAASNWQRSFDHATQLKVEPPQFSRHRGSDCWFALARFDPGATQAFWRESHNSRKRASERFWKDRESLRRTRGYDRH